MGSFFFEENFETGSFSDNDWEIEGDDNTGFEFTNAAGSNSDNSIFVNNFNYDAAGEIDGMVTQKLDLMFPNPILYFDAAYALKNAGEASDEVQISISTDCGDTFTPFAFVSGDDLISADPTSSAFVPTANQWKTHEVSPRNAAEIDHIAIWPFHCLGQFHIAFSIKALLFVATYKQL